MLPPPPMAPMVPQAISKAAPGEVLERLQLCRDVVSCSVSFLLAKIWSMMICLNGDLLVGGGNSNIFQFHPYFGKIPILTNIFQMGRNHQLVTSDVPMMSRCLDSQSQLFVP